jgi:aryl-phospho-beta-D-glucosidase BglC (GH1 family)
MNVTSREVVVLLLGLGFVIANGLAAGGAEERAADSPPPLPEPRPDWLPRWRGFNLLEKFQVGQGRRPFREADFRLISRLGFNFVRLPMDYRVWIRDGDPEQFDEEVLAEIDQAVAWGREYGMHVMLNFHRAPGWTVARPPEPLDLWTDPEVQRLCALHWGRLPAGIAGCRTGT